MIKLTGRIMPKRLFGKIRIDYGPYNGTLQSKIVEPSTEDQNVVADNGYNALSLVLVKAATLQEKTVTPSSQEQTVVPDVGVYGLSKVIVKPQGDHGLLEEITVTPTQEGQRITPSEGYYGIDVVNVEAAPLEELTIYPAYEKQTFTPSEGYYGIGSIVVEAMDDPGSGGGGGGGEGDEETEEIPSAENETFGGEYVVTQVPTGECYIVLKGGGKWKFPALPANGDYPYMAIFYLGSNPDVYMLVCSVSLPDMPTLNTHIYIPFKRHMCYYWGDEYGGWTLAGEPQGATYLIDELVWANYTVIRGSEVYYTPTEPEMEYTEALVYKTVEREELYTISGDTLNSIAVAVQALVGGGLMTPSGMAAALGSASANSTE